MHNSRLLSRLAVLPWAFSDQDPDMGSMYGGIHHLAESYPFSLIPNTTDSLTNTFLLLTRKKASSAQEVEGVLIYSPCAPWTHVGKEHSYF